MPAVFGPTFTHQPPVLRAKLIFNPASGRPDQSPGQLMEIIARMQAWRILPEVSIVHPKSDLVRITAEAVRSGIQLIVVAGGDGTIDTVAGALVDQPGTLGIIPTGTRNNVALSLGIPLNNIGEAVAIVRRGRHLRIDVGLARSGAERHWFLEAGTVGLISALYPAADDIQHGNLARIGDLLAALVSNPIFEIRLALDGIQEELTTTGHIVLVANMPYFGANFHLAPDISCSDGLLDVFVYSNLTKLDLLGYAVQVVGGSPEDPRIHHYQVRGLSIDTIPQMPVIADGFPLGVGTLNVSIQRHALAVMAGVASPAKESARTILAHEGISPTTGSGRVKDIHQGPANE